MTPEKQLEKVEKLFSMISEEYIKPEDMEEILVALMTAINEVKSNLEQNIALNKGELENKYSTLYTELESLEKTVTKSLTKIEGKMSNDLNSIRQQIYDKINEIQELIPEKTDLSTILTDIEEIKSKLNEEDVPEPEDPYECRNELEAIDNESEKLKIEAIQGLRKELDDLEKKIKSSGGRNIFGGGFNVSALNIHIIDDETPSGTKNGSNTIFTIGNSPSPVSSLKVYRNGQRLRITEDYTFSGTTITFVVPPESDDVLLVDYRV